MHEVPGVPLGSALPFSILPFAPMQIRDVDPAIASTIAVNEIVGRIVDVEPLAKELARKTMTKLRR